MKVWYLNNGLKRPVISGFIAILSGFCFWPQQSPAQESSQSAITVDPLKYVSWTSGPQKVSLALGSQTIADVNIPQGYRLTGTRGARIILDSVNNPAPDDVIGVLAPNSGKWWALLEYSFRGFVKDANIAQINADNVLKEAQDRINADQAASSMTTLNWQSRPVYDASSHLWNWSLNAQTPSAKVLNQMAVLLGRHGVLQITAIQPYPLTDAPSLKQLAANITFKDGERYADYQSGDKVAKIGLADFIAGGKQSEAADHGMVFWIYCYLAACIVVGGTVVLLRKKHHHQPQPVRAKAPVAVAAKPAVIDVPAIQEPSPAETNGHLNGHSQSKAPLEEKRESRQFHRNRRKRVFDYPKFYTNVMNELSLRSYGGSGTATNGKAKTNGHTNGHANGNTNGHSNGHANGHTNGNGANGISESIKAEIVELISTQKSLIQEQKCLLEQQTRLIEEKRWLIEEQTAFLKGQSGLMDEQQYPLKFE